MGLYIFTLASPTLMSNSEVQWCGKGQISDSLHHIISLLEMPEARPNDLRSEQSSQSPVQPRK
jgi:hypothetical protein